MEFEKIVFTNSNEYSFIIQLVNGHKDLSFGSYLPKTSLSNKRTLVMTKISQFKYIYVQSTGVNRRHLQLKQ